MIRWGVVVDHAGVIHFIAVLPSDAFNGDAYMENVITHGRAAGEGTGKQELIQDQLVTFQHLGCKRQQRGYLASRNGC